MDETVESEPPTLEEQIASLPKEPGVYTFKDAEGEILYVGKAAVLQKRVRDHFRASSTHDHDHDHDHSHKHDEMVARVAVIDPIITATEAEALILESNLIKYYQPRYNVRLKDDKHYPYIILTDHRLPKLMITRRTDRKARYFGPYSNAGALKRIVRFLKQHFGLRDCSERLFQQGPCLNYEIGLCSGPCIGAITGDEYRDNVAAAEKILRGRVAPLKRELEARMWAAAEKLAYETAARVRKQLEGLATLAEEQRVESRALATLDILGLATHTTESDAAGATCCVAVFAVREKKVLSREQFLLDAPPETDDAAILASFIPQYYASNPIPRELLLPTPLSEHEEGLLEEWLGQRRGGRRWKVSILYPQRGRKAKLLELAHQNARYGLHEERLRSMTANKLGTHPATEELQEALGLERVPDRIDGLDISTLGGSFAVGSAVVFENGYPRKSEYRRYKIKEVEGQDDFASLAEVARRRYRRMLDEARPLPDLVLIDGGFGQVNTVKWELAALAEERDAPEVREIPLVGIMKAEELLAQPGAHSPLRLPRDSVALHLLQHVRDEAHRFAITYHRTLRKKGLQRSALDEVHGIGPKRKRALLRQFRSVERVAEARVDELAAVVGINRALATRVYEEFHANNENGDGEDDDNARGARGQRGRSGRKCEKERRGKRAASTEPN